MRNVSQAVAAEGPRSVRLVVLTLLTTILALSARATAQINVNETDLHDGQTVYGLEAPGAPIPYLNLETIHLWAWGANDANYPNSSFYAYGLYTGIDLINSGAVDVNAVGGTATVVGGVLVEAYGIGGTGSVDNSGNMTVGATGGTGVFDPFILANNFANTGPDTRAYGISTSGTVHNDGTILVTATGGPGTMEEVGDPDNIGYASLFVRTDAQGISAGDVDNTGAITAIASGATLVLASTGKTTAYGSEDSGAIGILAEGDATNSGDIVATATGGNVTATAETYAYAYADPEAYGIIVTGNLVNSGAITAGAIAGTSSSNYQAFASSFAMGIWGETDQDPAPTADNSGDIDVTAAGGDATAESEAAATAGAWGMRFTGDMTNSGDITAAATGGSAAAADRAWAYGYTFGLYAYPPGSGAVDANTVNSGAIDVSAAGGTAETEDRASTYAEAQGIVGGGDVANEGDIGARALGGTADGGQTVDAYAAVHGISTYRGDVTNTGSIDVNATGGTATGTTDAEVSARGEAYAIHATGDIDNSGALAVQATGGAAAAQTGVTDAKVEAYGIFGQGQVANTGAISVTGTAGTATTDSSPPSGANAFVEIHGINAGGDVSNEGDISLAAAAGSANSSSNSEAYALAEGIFSGGHVANTGDITTAATGGTADAHDGYSTEAGANSYGILALSGNVSNAGRLTINATAGTATSQEDADADVDAYGILSGGDVDNSGDLVAVATAGTANGWETAVASVDLDGIRTDGTVNNSGAIAVTATGGMATVNLDGRSEVDVWVSGIIAGGAIYNMGDISVTATGGTGSDAGEVDAGVNAWGLYSHSGAGVANTGDIAVAAVGPTADNGDASTDMDVYAVAIQAAAIDNTGTITVAATGGHMVEGNDEASTNVSVFGLRSEATRNTGAVTVTAAGPTAGGLDVIDEEVFACGIAGANVDNSGNVSVTATTEAGSRTYAIGIDMYGDGTLTNTGTVRAFADTAYELRAGYGTTRLVGTYNVTLDGDPDDASIYVADRASLALNNATLTVMEVPGETLWDTPYRLFEVDPDGAVTGRFGTVRAINPDATAVYYTQGTSNAADDRVALTYAPQASETVESASVEKYLVSQPIDIVNRHMTGTLLQSILYPGATGLLADAGPTARSMALAQSAPKTRSGVFVEPYYSRMEHDANPLGYDADLWGFAAGCERRFENTLVALHMGYGRANVDYTGAGYNANSEDQDILTGGLSGLTLWNDWTVRYGLAGFYGSQDYKGLTGLGLTETEEGSTDSYGALASVMAGRILRHGSHVFLPEAGLNYLWGHRRGYTTRSSDPAWNTTYSAMNDHDLQAEAALHWLCGFMHKSVHITPSASIGIRHLLTDAESTVTQSVPGAAPASVTSERDRTAMTLSGSVVLTKNRHALAVVYDGEYSPDTERHSVWLRYAWQF
ncbi:MAG TPA: autotransporter outer membrane beta-barrel domain-containing protein [Sedimentisphaerales bacterium]|nr:autotransporter outer membrane beta-barrel domain-containing protein [Sedimentisphaerales bacterium]